MFDRVVCLAIRMAASPRVDSAALIALKTCLADVSGTGLRGGPLSNASALVQGGAPATRIRELPMRHKYRNRAAVKQLDLFS
jgi:hypothetical protein